MAEISPEELAKAELVLDSVRDEWLQRPGVTAVDLGFKWHEGKMTNELSIRVHVTEKKDVVDLNEAEIFPKEVDGVTVDVLEATYGLHQVIDIVPEAAVEGRGRRWDTIPLGVSIGCEFSTAGTLGAKVIDRETGDEMILSNWHVMAARQNPQEGQAIWQPGWIDGGKREENTIAVLTRWVLGPYDAAVARLTGTREVQTSTLEGRVIDDIAGPKLGMNVWKSGRSTGFTQGFIDGVKMKVPLSYREAGTHMLEQVFRIVPRPGAPPSEISIGGDSGSVWVDEASGKAVGLHFAGEVGDSPEHALAHDLTVIVEALNVRLPGQAPPEPPPPEPPPPEPPAPKPPAPEPPSPKPPPDPTPTPAGGRSFWDTLADLIRKLFGSR